MLIHSPLVGPMTLMPFAEELRRHGWSVSIPDLRDALSAPRPQWQAIVDLAAAGQGQPDIIVGHSGAGVVLPTLADVLDPTFVAFVDAVVPDAETYAPSAEFVQFIDSLDLEESLLPPWNIWWGHDAMIELIPDAELRERIVAEIPRVPRSFYDDAVALPSRWSDRDGCLMLQLSDGYEQFRRRAEMFGWATDAIDGQHLDIATRPGVVVEHLLQLIVDKPIA